MAVPLKNRLFSNEVFMIIEKILFAIVVILAALTAGITHATPRPTLHIYYERSSDALPASNLTYVVRELRRHFKEEFNVVPKFKIKGVSASPIPRKLDKLRDHYAYWNNRLSKLKIKYRWAMVITSRFEKDGLQYFAGLGNPTCFNFERGLTLSMMSMAAKNDAGEDRLRYSIYGAMHELGHNLNLGHLNTLPPTIMHSGVLGHSHQDLHFNDDQKWRAGVCFRMRS